jgi:hypothetical protein
MLVVIDAEPGVFPTSCALGCAQRYSARTT